jgi:hypothetical protein
MPPRKQAAAPLRSVKPGEKPPAPAKKTAKRPPATIAAAAAMEERDLLVAMRTKVAKEIDRGVPAHALAGLMRQLREFDKEIRAIDARDESEQQDQEPKDDGGDVDESFDASAI